jgi:hypothetical protein
MSPKIGKVRGNLAFACRFSTRISPAAKSTRDHWSLRSSPRRLPQ